MPALPFFLHNIVYKALTLFDGSITDVHTFCKQVLSILCIMVVVEVEGGKTHRSIADVHKHNITEYVTSGIVLH